MSLASAFRLSPEAKIKLPNVDEALNIGYAMHSADDPALTGKLAQHNARIVVKQFLALEAAPGTAEEGYLNCLRAIVLSQARGIGRRKERYINDLRAAQLQRRRKRNAIREARRSSDWLNSAWRLLGPLILGLAGFLSAHLIGMFVPRDVAAETGSRIPAILMGLVFVAVGRSAGFYLAEMQRNKIEAEYNSRCYLAFLSYELGKLKEFKQYRKQLCEAWLEYTGEEYPATASYQMVMESDIETRRQLERHLQVYETGYVRLLIRFIRIIRGKRRNHEEKLPTLPAELVPPSMELAAHNKE
ncbi:MAG: hypothetical protein J2P53_00970 [Bradyrhizobiaceae bacterium]|nr:hypothetical protein [Bradyrhizobiaceae bacterium]